MLNNKILSCGLTGNFGFFHTKISILYGTNIVSGLNYKKKGSLYLNLPIFSSSYKSVKITKCKISIIFIPSYFCKNIIIENIYSGIKIIVCISEDITLYDMLKIKFFCNKYNILFIGPNSPGIIIPFYKIRLGIFPIKNIIIGNLFIFSRSGTLTYKAIKLSRKNKLGQSLCLGIGGDIIIGLNIKKFFSYFINFNLTKNILIIGEIGSTIENQFLKYKKKKIFFFISGIFSPLKTTMGHSGAINNKFNDILKKIKKIKKYFLILNNLNEINLIK
ncbi:succinyl-CoA synthetase alpha subunit [Candidatus Carsonella ruddii HT isolate Thao2000]|uniref:Succinyl-CoA synthetase alpha subunit n=1 Tax=Candidatus Carsonella ruddii HT isolate Thao2000 TaxID=1202539 RepID=J3TEH0_CARRU|nr:succinyl-CoA synthetase subunit alpha [Candidatus Carsonella ruddii]AFP84147.1 succinyl-CoA synthetase alpha subunit [Candidatus Carsonella ruddii HT isolate Thao2000]